MFLLSKCSHLYRIISIAFQIYVELRKLHKAAQKEKKRYGDKADVFILVDILAVTSIWLSLQKPLLTEEW